MPSINSRLAFNSTEALRSGLVNCAEDIGNMAHNYTYVVYYIRKRKTELINKELQKIGTSFEEFINDLNVMGFNVLRLADEGNYCKIMYGYFNSFRQSKSLLAAHQYIRPLHYSYYINSVIKDYVELKNYFPEELPFNLLLFASYSIIFLNSEEAENFIITGDECKIKSISHDFLFDYPSPFNYKFSNFSHSFVYMNSFGNNSYIQDSVTSFELNETEYKKLVNAYKENKFQAYLDFKNNKLW